MMQRYLLLDGAQIDNLPEWFARLQHFTPTYPLYLKTAYAELAERGPVLIPLLAESGLLKTFANQWCSHAGLLLESEACEGDVIGHLRSMVHARLDGDVVVLFRYYDPRIARPWLTALEPCARDLFMGPIRVIRLPDTDGSELIIRQENPGQPSATFTVRPWIALSTAQIEHLDQTRQQRLNQRMIDHCEVFFPQALSGLNSAARQQWANACRQHAARHGYSSEADVARWISLYVTQGPQFPEKMRQRRYREILNDWRTPPAVRLDQLLAEQAVQQILDKDIDA